MEGNAKEEVRWISEILRYKKEMFAACKWMLSVRMSLMGPMNATKNDSLFGLSVCPCFH